MNTIGNWCTRCITLKANRPARTIRPAGGMNMSSTVARALVLSTAWLLSAMLLLSLPAGSAARDQVDPNHRATGGFGYLLSEQAQASVWWAESTYKILRDAPVPRQSASQITLHAARNEFVSFQLVVSPHARMDRFRIEHATLADGQGNHIDVEQVTVRKVEYVHVTRPTDTYGKTGLWPDPLPLYDRPQTMHAAENQPFFITIHVPESAVAGVYAGELMLSAAGWRMKVPLQLTVWDFELPTSPSMRSGFGFNLANVKRYDNIHTPEQERQVFEYYMQTFRDYRISPYNPFELSPIKETVTGVAWEGGFFDSERVYEGTYAYRVEDHSFTSNEEARLRELRPVQNGVPYELRWVAATEEDGRRYVVGVEGYNAERELLVFENRFEIYSGTKEWKAERLPLGEFRDEIRYVMVRLFPTETTPAGEHTGTVWFDNLELVNRSTGENELPEGDFEQDLDAIDIVLDFTEFNKAGRRYFDEYGFTGYRLFLRGLGGGTYYSRTEGVFEGFAQGTPEYERLMERYLGQMQANLKETGWLGKEYIYWFDEPNEPDYPFVRETNALIKRYAPEITTFITEHVSGQDISDVTDISCSIWHRLDHEKIARMNELGLEHWSYLCTWPRSPWISLFIDHDAINLRLWLWASYQIGLKGILIWESTYWNSDAASPPGYLQNPWEEAMSFVTSYGWPLGKQTGWGNGDGRFFYPNNRDPNNDTSTYVAPPVPSLRLEFIREGIQDYEYFIILEQLVEQASNPRHRYVRQARELLTLPTEMYTDEQTYSKDPRALFEHRIKLAEAIVRLKSLR